MRVCMCVCVCSCSYSVRSIRQFSLFLLVWWSHTGKVVAVGILVYDCRVGFEQTLSCFYRLRVRTVFRAGAGALNLLSHFLQFGFELGNSTLLGVGELGLEQLPQLLWCQTLLSFRVYQSWSALVQVLHDEVVLVGAVSAYLPTVRSPVSVTVFVLTVLDLLSYCVAFAFDCDLSTRLGVGQLLLDH